MQPLSLDYQTLSAYLDGELDSLKMRNIEEELEQNANGRKFLYDTLHTTVRLRADGRKTLSEPVPPELERTILAPPTGNTPAKSIRWFQPLQMSFAFAVLVLCIGVGVFLLTSNSKTPSYFYPTLPEGFVQAVSQSLESNLSGDSLLLSTGKKDQSILITPTKTYKDKHGQYYRDFQMEYHLNGIQQQVTGLAVRKGEKEWIPTAIYYPKR